MNDYLNLAGNIAAITGGRRGLGRAMTLAMVEHGVKVAVISQSPEADELMQQIQDMGGEGFYIQANLSKREERSAVIDKVVERFGRLDILINNAGMQHNESVSTCTLEEWDTSRAILLDATFELSQQAASIMIKQGSGKIINLSSICAFREGGYNFSYGVMKTAVVGMTRCMANSLAQHNINVNAIAPGIWKSGLDI